MLNGENIYIRSFVPDDGTALLNFQTKNRNFFEKFSMARNSDFYTIDGQLNMINKFDKERRQDLDYHFGIFGNDNNKLVGTVNLFQVLRGSLQSAFIGYFIDRKHNGRGYATEAVQLIVEYGFNTLQLHRIEAGVMPHNIGSIRVLEKSGFHKEGLAKKNVKINGRWEDHQVLAIINLKD